MTRKLGNIKFVLYLTFIAVVLVQFSVAKTDTDSDGDLKLNLVGDKVKDGSAKSTEKRMW